MKITKIALMFFAAASIIITGCQKEKTVEPSNQNTTSIQQLSNDEEHLEKVSDEALNDADNFLNSPGSLKSTADLPCNAIVDTAIIANDSITYYIIYNGLNCSNTLIRTGTITISHKLGEQWWQAGTTVLIKLNNFHVVRVSDNHWITINGYHLYQNVSGSNASTIIHKAWGQLNTLYDDATTSVWNTARQKSLTGALGSLIFTLDGFGTNGDQTNLVEWGTTREGKAFYSRIDQIITCKQACLWKPVSGIKYHAIPADNKNATVTFGYNDNNQPIGPDECPTKYRLDWQANGNSGTFYLALGW